MNPDDAEILKENVKLAKQKQSYQDINRIERKAFREYARLENAVSKYNKELVEIFDNYKLSKLTSSHKENSKAVGVIQFSDVHFNELVDLEHNKYDFSIASARCKQYVRKAIKYFNDFDSGPNWREMENIDSMEDLTELVQNHPVKPDYSYMVFDPSIVKKVEE